MNERIKELAFEAKIRAAILLDHYGTVDALTDSEQESLDQIEKFAELIIEECARRCDVVRENVGGDRQFGARLCADEIRYLNRRS